jgi:3-isopropylmalate dehydrogenase
MRQTKRGKDTQAGFLSYLTGTDARHRLDTGDTRPLIGVVEGTGIGREIIGAALQVLAAAEQVLGIQFEVRTGGQIGKEAVAGSGRGLPKGLEKFFAGVFQRGGAILSGPAGGRYVYDLRRRFDLFCKFVPVRPWPELARAAKLVPKHLQGVDFLIVRDNAGGVYQGTWSERVQEEGRIAEHSFQYSESEVRRLMEVAARAAAFRRGTLHVILKEGGVPAVSALWREVGASVARKRGIEVVFMNVDFAVYQLIQNPREFDVIAAPNLIGDILADVAGVLVSSRGVTFSGNFDATGHGVYQTNHGCAQDLAGTDTANPAGQILALAMLLRESFGMQEAAALIERSLAHAWRQGWRTADLAEPGCTILGTKAFTERVVQQILRQADIKTTHEPCAAAG